MLCLSSQSFKDWRANSVDSDVVAHDEPPHLDLPCLQIHLFEFFISTLGVSCFCENVQTDETQHVEFMKKQ